MKTTRAALISLCSIAVLLLAYIAITVTQNKSSVVWLTPQAETSISAPAPKPIPTQIQQERSTQETTAAGPPDPCTPRANSIGVPCNRPETTSAQPASRTVSFALMPQQSIDVPNSRFAKLEIHSQFPLRIMSGRCQQTYTVEFVCNDIRPSDIFIMDVRPHPIFKTPQGNLITLTGAN